MLCICVINFFELFYKAFAVVVVLCPVVQSEGRGGHGEAGSRDGGS